MRALVSSCRAEFGEGFDAEPYQNGSGKVNRIITKAAEFRAIRDTNTDVTGHIINEFDFSPGRVVIVFTAVGSV